MKIPESYIPLINIGLVVWLLIAIIMGYKKGFLWQLVRLLGLLVCVAVSWIVAPGLAKLINLFPKAWAPFANTSVGMIVYERINFLCWFIVVILIGLIILMIIGPLFKALTELPFLKQANGILGALLGIIRTFIFFMVVTYLLNSALIKNGKDIIEKSWVKYINMATDKVVAIISNSFDENVAIQKLLSDPLSLDKNDLKSIIDWMQSSKLSSDQIRDFLNGYGIDTNTINELLGNGK